MQIRNIIGALLLTAAIFAGGNLPAARAGASPYDDDVLDLSQNVGLVDLGISLDRNPDLPADNFIIGISPLIGNMTGCPPYKNISFETGYSNTTLEITLISISVDNSEYPYYKCNGKAVNPHADVIVNKNDLIKRKIDQLKIISGPFMETFDMTLNNRMVFLEEEKGTKSVGLIKKKSVQGVKNPMKLWFYPEGTLLLYAPYSGDDTRQVAEKIHALATIKGLQPLEEIYPDFKSPLVKGGFYYYVDTDGRFSGGDVIGNINIDKMAYGLDGDKPVQEELPVYAKRPGARD